MDLVNTFQNDAAILMAPGFEERLVVECLLQLRSANFGVTLVGIVRGPMAGERGLRINPDYMIDDLPIHVMPRLTLLPGGWRCASTLKKDPRMHQFIKASLQRGGAIAISRKATVLFEADLLVYDERDDNTILFQQEMELSEFIPRLIKKLTFRSCER
jgi:hypothetical protein